MRAIVTGNGLAGVIFSKTLRELNPQMEIDVFAEEKYHYYPRPNLIEYLALNLPYERIFAFSDDWYREKKINIHLQTPVRRLHPDKGVVEIKGEKREKYDFLFLSNGAHPFIPPFKGTEKKGVFSLRTLDDCLALLDYTQLHNRVSIIGGGVLGLEIARGMKARKVEVDVVEYNHYLLPRQLDSKGAALLKEQIEEMGIRVHLGLTTQEILGEEKVSGLKFKEGEEIGTEMAIIAAGVRPNIQLAKEAGLEVGHGVTVDDFLRTSHPRIYAGGDNVQHQGKTYGIIPASFAQAKIAARNVAGEKEKYKGTTPSNTLKVAGIYLTSIGLVNEGEENYEVLRREDKEKGIYKKLVLQNGIPIGAIWMGTKKGVNEINRIISQKVNVEKWKHSMLEEDFDFSII